MAKQDTGGDASSLSDPNAATFTHLSVAWDVNFDTHVITATAQYDVTVHTKGADLFLDTKGLSVSSVSVDGTEIADWTLEDDIEVRYLSLITIVFLGKFLFRAISYTLHRCHFYACIIRERTISGADW